MPLIAEKFKGKEKRQMKVPAVFAERLSIKFELVQKRFPISKRVDVFYRVFKKIENGIGRRRA